MSAMLFTSIFAIIFAGAGCIFFIPCLYKLARCTATTTDCHMMTVDRTVGKDSSVRGRYEFTVDGKTYTGKTTWTNYGFSNHVQRKVRYCPKNPKVNYITGLWFWMNLGIGLLFVLAGFFVIRVGFSIQYYEMIWDLQMFLFASRILLAIVLIIVALTVFIAVRGMRTLVDEQDPSLGKHFDSEQYKPAIITLAALAFFLIFLFLGMAGKVELK